MRHIISVDDFSAEDIRILFERAEIFKRDWGARPIGDFSRANVMSLFFEPSSRTSMSFRVAATELGCRVYATDNADKFSSDAKGESLEDTIRVMSGYCLARSDTGAIILRHRTEGSAARAATVSRVPVINAGDGANEHPTQALLDLFTIWEACRKGVLSDRSISVHFYGDNRKGRTVRSLAKMLARHAATCKLPIKCVTFGGPDKLCSDPDFEIVRELEGIGGFDVGIGFPMVNPQADVHYFTRFQKERYEAELSDGAPVPSFAFAAEDARALPAHAMIMHPLPRVREMAIEIDADPRAAYFDPQAMNGVYTRMALLEHVLFRR